MKRNRNPHVTKPIAFDPRSGHGPEFTKRLIKVLREEHLEGWQIQERFGISEEAIQHYRVQAQRKAG